MLYNKDFLLKLDKQKNKTIYGRVTALNYQENPIETIEGRLTQGSVNVDGASAVRRTCSLTLVAQDFSYHDYYWGLNTKFKLEVGLENTVDSSQPDIVWFKLGMYLITSCNTSNSTNNFTISLQGKDKMCQLNGDVGGHFMQTVVLDTIEEETSDGNVKIRKIPIPEIIRNLLHTYGGEPYHNIIINDLDDIALELLEYRYDVPMYLYRETDSPIYNNVTLDGGTACEVDGSTTTLSGLDATQLEMLVDPLSGSSEPAIIKIEGAKYHVAKIEYGQTAGYRQTELTYPKELIASIGETITGKLDVLKNMLGEYEYFYDVDGRFVFQKKQAFINTIWTPESNSKEAAEYAESLATASNYTYIFSEGELISAFNNNPNLLNLRNDYSIWGERETVSGVKIPIHLRYAIDRKPQEYHPIMVTEADVAAYNQKYGTALQPQIDTECVYARDSDWREIIYLMASDYYKYNFLDDFELRVIEANKNNSEEWRYSTGRTGYEQYYSDIQGYWRDLYNGEMEVQVAGQNVYGENSDEPINASITSPRVENNYYIEGEHAGWNVNVYEHPELLNFWFDFLDTEGELSQFSVQKIGARTKPINDADIKSIYFRETPDIIFKKPNETSEGGSNYKYIQANNSMMTSMFSISSQGLSAKDKLDELIYNHSYCIESATINSIPIYYLEPNTRICVYDSKTDLNGDYIISKMTIPLTYNGMMSITATRAAETLW